MRDDARLRPEERLHRPREFRRVLEEGSRAASGCFVLLVASRPGAERDRPRLGITASRKVGRAIRRNRAKRLIREWFRRAKQGIDEGLDLVVIARRGAPELGAREAGEELCAGLARARCALAGRRRGEGTPC